MIGNQVDEFRLRTILINLAIKYSMSFRPLSRNLLPSLDSDFRQNDIKGDCALFLIASVITIKMADLQNDIYSLCISSHHEDGKTPQQSDERTLLFLVVRQQNPVYLW